MKQWTKRVRFQARRIVTEEEQSRIQDTPRPDLNLLDRNPTAQVDKETFASLLRECGRRKSLGDGHRIHRHIFNFGLERDLYLANTLVQMYGNCGCLASATSVFQSIQDPNSVSWHMIMLAFSENDQLQEVKRHFDRMPEVRKNTISWNIITTAYAQNGHVQEAREFFGQAPTKDIVSWNTILSAYVRGDRAAEAIRLFRQLDLEPDRVTLVCGIDACASVLARDLGRELHARAISKSFHTHVVVATSLVNMYGKFGCLTSAREAFNAVPVGGGDVVLRTSMLTALSENGEFHEAKELFCSARKRDVVCWTSMIVACGVNSELEEAERAFGRMPAWSVVSWNAMIAAFVQNGEYKQAVELFRELDFDGMGVDKISCISALDACANLNDLELGRIIHSDILGDKELFGDPVVKTSVLNLYGKCGKLLEARNIFDCIVNKPIASWNAMISSYAQKGHGNRVFELYRLLNLDGKIPDMVTFICVISACSHAGLVEDGRGHFLSISSDFDSSPTKDHYSCMLDLLGRAGWLNEAEELVEFMPFEPNAVELTAVLGGCEIHGDIQRGKRVSVRFIDLEEEDEENVGVAPYLLLSNLHATAGNHDDLASLRKFMVKNGIKRRRAPKVTLAV